MRLMVCACYENNVRFNIVYKKMIIIEMYVKYDVK